jgi:hypothetical protein
LNDPIVPANRREPCSDYQLSKCLIKPFLAGVADSVIGCMKKKKSRVAYVILCLRWPLTMQPLSSEHLHRRNFSLQADAEVKLFFFF